jgi:hypothetical protein
LPFFKPLNKQYITPLAYFFPNCSFKGMVGLFRVSK